MRLALLAVPEVPGCSSTSSGNIDGFAVLTSAGLFALGVGFEVFWLEM